MTAAGGPPPAGAVVVAGGRSRRMGRDKAWLPLAGEPLLARVAGVVAEACAPVVVVGAPGRALPPLPPGVEVLEDPPARAGEGPLPAVLTGLEALAARGVAVAYLGAVDAPRLTSAHVRFVLARLHAAGPEVDAALPTTGVDEAARSHPLAAAVRVVAVRDRAARLVAGGERRLRRLLAAPLRVAPVAEAALPDPGAIAPCNTPEDWARLTGAGS